MGAGGALVLLAGTARGLGGQGSPPQTTWHRWPGRKAWPRRGAGPTAAAAADLVSEQGAPERHQGPLTMLAEAPEGRKPLQSHVATFRVLEEDLSPAAAAARSPLWPRVEALSLLPHPRFVTPHPNKRTGSLISVRMVAPDGSGVGHMSPFCQRGNTRLGRTGSQADLGPGTGGRPPCTPLLQSRPLGGQRAGMRRRRAGHWGEWALGCGPAPWISQLPHMGWQEGRSWVPPCWALVKEGEL